MKTKKPDDLDRYIAQRKEKDAEFSAAYDSEQAEWELGQLLAKTRESAGLTQDALARKIGSAASSGPYHGGKIALPRRDWSDSAS